MPTREDIKLNVRTIRVPCWDCCSKLSNTSGVRAYQVLIILSKMIGRESGITRAMRGANMNNVMREEGNVVERIGVSAARNNNQRVGSVSAIMQPQEATITNRSPHKLIRNGASSVITIIRDGKRKRAARHREIHNSPGVMASQRLIAAMPAAAAGTTVVIGISM